LLLKLLQEAITLPSRLKSTSFHAGLPNLNNMFSFSFSRLFPSWFCDATLSRESLVMNETSNVMDEPHSGQEISIGVDNMEAENAMRRPTIQKIKRWRATELVEWIQRVLDPPLDPDDAEKITQTQIDGRVFLKGAGDLEFFMRAGLSFGASVNLAELANGVTGTAIQGKLLSFIPYSKH
jgi:hypothetical protein